jgi:hypothetical protein
MPGIHSHGLRNSFNGKHKVQSQGALYIQNNAQLDKSLEADFRDFQSHAFGERIIVNVCIERCWSSKRALAYWQ